MLYKYPERKGKDKNNICRLYVIIAEVLIKFSCDIIAETRKQGEATSLNSSNIIYNCK